MILRTLVALVVALALATVSLGANASAAQTEAEPTQLRLVDQTPFVDPDGTLVVRLALAELAAELVAAPPITGEGEGEEEEPIEQPLSIAVTVFGRVDDVDDLDATPTQALNRVPAEPIAPDRVDDGGILTIELPIRSGQSTDDVERMLIPDAGVYPISFQVLDASGVRAELTTTLIRLPLDDRPTPIDLVAAIDTSTDGGPSLDETIELLTAEPGAPITVLAGPAQLARLGSDPAMVDALRAALGDRSLVVAPQPRIDPSSVAAIGREDRYRAAIAATQAELQAVGLSADSEIALSAEPLTAAGATAVTSTGVTVAIDRSSIPSGGRVETADGRLAIVAPDEFAIGDTAPGAGRAHRLLAELTLAPAERPLLLLAGSGAGSVDFNTLAELVAMAEADPLLNTLALAAAAPGIATLPYRPPPTATVDLTPILDRLARAEALLATYTSFYEAGPDSPGELRAGLDRALATDLDPAQRADAVAAIGDQLAADLDVISLPSNQSVTLAARSAPIPLIIQSSATGPREVMLQFESDKFVVAEEGKIITIAPGTSSIDVEVEARSLGASPLQVSVVSPDESRRVLATTRFQVRSTAVPGLGLAISAVGLLLLGAWWYLSIRRKRNDDPSEDRPGDASQPTLDSTHEITRTPVTSGR